MQQTIPSSLVRTKFFRPRTSSDVIPRIRLIERLNAGLRSKVTLIAAYVLNTVFLAVVLFLTAIAENFRWNTVRAVILIVALGMLLFGIYHLFTYPVI